jgi:MFS superfamily sulfate permease-like transporter
VGQMPSPTEFRQLSESPEAKEVPGLKIFMIKGAMFYANSSLVKKEIKALVMAPPRPNMIAIVLIETMHELDITSTRALESAIKTAQEEGVEVVLVSVPILALSSLRKAGIVELVGEDHIMNDLYTMVNHYRQKYGADEDVREQG